MKKNLYSFMALLISAVLLFVLFIVVDSSQARSGDVVDFEVKSHTVVKGDTLWDISAKYLDDPFRWPSIWKKNPQIENPHLIYPGDIVRFTKDSIEIVRNGKVVTKILAEEDFDDGTDEEVLEEEEVFEEEYIEEDFDEEIIEEESATFSVPGTMKDGFITKEALKLSGMILKSKTSNTILAAGDEVFISFKNRVEVLEGDLYTIFKEGREIRRDDEMRTLIGHVIEIIGTVEVTFDGKAAEALITMVYQEVEEGMKLTEYIEPVKDVELVEVSRTMTALIAAADSDAQQIAETNLIYLNKGAKYGFKVGNVLEISRPRLEVDDPLRKREKIGLPNRVIGKAVVVRVSDASAMAFVFKSSLAIIEGDTVTAGPDITIE